ncbi:MAG: hypothetical protein ACRD28_02105, partial [Acidobacteriaceae bacterium]
INLQWVAFKLQIHEGKYLSAHEPGRCHPGGERRFGYWQPIPVRTLIGWQQLRIPAAEARRPVVDFSAIAGQ